MITTMSTISSLSLSTQSWFQDSTALFAGYNNKPSIVAHDAIESSRITS